MRSFFYTIRQAFLQFGRNFNMGLASIFAITAMLLILSVFFIAALNMNIAAQTIRGDYDTIEIYLKDKVTEKKAQTLIEDMKATDGVADAEYKSKKKAMKEFRKRWGENGYLLDNLEENPLPNSIVVQIADLEKADYIASRAEKLKGAEDVKFYKDTVDRLLKITDFMQWAAVILMAFLILVSIVVVSNTIKLTVFNRADEISIMKYIGATNWFIRGPFLVEGIIIGVISAAISVGLTALIYHKLVELIGDQMFSMLSIPMVPEEFLIYNLAWIFLALGVSIGACGSIISIRKFLNTEGSRHGRRALALLIIAVMGAGFVLFPACANASELSDLNKEIKQKRQELKEGKHQVKEMMDEIVDLEEDIDALDTQIAVAADDLEVLTEELEKARKKVNRQDKNLNIRLRNMYKNGSVGFLDVLLNSGSLNDFLTNLDMVQRILKSDEKVLAGLKEAHKEIKKKKEEVEVLQAELEDARMTAREEKAEVARQKEELTKENKRTADDIGDLEAEREALEEKLAAQSRNGEISNSGTSKYKGGVFLWPLPASSTVTSDYGWRMCPYHGREFHAALDIGGASSGSPIVASAAGKVVQAGWYGGFGISVIIDHGGGLTTQYNHCSGVNVSAGQKVKRGETIAFLGSTGFSTGPHLDYRVYKDGNVDNPWNYL